MLTPKRGPGHLNASDPLTDALPRKLHILSVIHYPVFGGPHNRNASVIPLLADRGVETTVLLPDEPGDAADRLRARGVDLITLPLGRIRATSDPRVHLRFAANLPTEVTQIREVIRCRGIDLVLVNGLINPQAGLAARLEGVPVTWQLLDTFPPWAMRLVLMPLVRVLADSLMTSGNAVATAHPGAKGFGERLISFFPIVDADRFRPDSERASWARRELGVPSEAVVVGNVSNFNPMKGHLTFVRAAARLHATHPDVYYVMLGGSYAHHAGYLHRIRREIRELRLDGRIAIRDPGKQVAELASAFDLFWLTSEPRSEGVSTVVGEAMALGLPVVATDVGSVAEAVEHTVTGFMVPPRDPQAIAAASVSLVENPQLRCQLGLAGRRRAESLYDATACARSHVQAFDAALRNHDRGATRIAQANTR